MACIVSDKITIVLIVLLHAVSFYPLGDFKIFLFLLCFQQGDYNVSKFNSPYDYCALRFPELLGSMGQYFSPDLELFSHYVFKHIFFFILSLSFPFGNLNIHLLDWLITSHRSQRFWPFFSTFFFFLWFSLDSFYSPEFMFNDLSSYSIWSTVKSI